MDKGYNRKRNTLDLKRLFCYEKIYSKKEKYKFKPHGDMIFPLSDWQNSKSLISPGWWDYGETGCLIQCWWEGKLVKSQ